MKTGFKNPLEKSSKEKKSPFNFDQPPYDERSSCYVNAGSHHGVGHKQPIGHMGNPKSKVDCLPYGRVNTMKVSGIPHHNLSLELDE